MLIGQITDTHIGFEPDRPDEPNKLRFTQTLDYLIHSPNRPDLLLLTGDLTDQGDDASYAWLAERLAQCPFPVWPAMGNHDVRATFMRHFPQVPMVDGFVQYVLPFPGLRVIVLDTLEEGRHGGAFCERRAAWLRARLEEAPDCPTIIAMHHPPVAVGIDWMDPDPGEAWIGRFAATIAGHRQIQSVLCGHVHRPILAPWRGLTVTICPSTAPVVALDLTRLDPEDPDDRAMIVADPPGFALHRWTGDGLVSHYDNANAHAILARFDGTLQPLVTMLADERRFPTGAPPRTERRA